MLNVPKPHHVARQFNALAKLYLRNLSDLWAYCSGRVGGLRVFVSSCLRRERVDRGRRRCLAPAFREVPDSGIVAV